jgi:hypothetical protein
MMKRWIEFEITMGGARRVLPLSRRTVSCSMERDDIRGISCFGIWERESGQSLLPLPPDRMTG